MDINYSQNYPVCDQEAVYGYDDHYEQQPADNPADLQVPDARLYAEGFTDVEQYQRLTNYQDPAQEQNDVDETPQPRTYYYENQYQSQRHHPHRTRVPKPHLHHFPRYRYQQGHGGYVNCPLVKEQTRNQQEYTESYHDPYADYRAAQNYWAMLYGDHKNKSLYHSQKPSRTTGNKKYPVTVKTPKYVTRNVAAQCLNKKPSALSLPVVTQPDPALFKKKNRTNHITKRTLDQSEPYYPNTGEETAPCTYSAHQMDSEGDLNKQHQLNYETNKLGPVQNNARESPSNVKAFAKFLKPRVPPSIRARQEKVAQMKASLNMLGVPIQPKMKVSLDKLLNRLQKCESQLPEEEPGEEVPQKTTARKEDERTSSFNYEKLSQKVTAPEPEEDLKPTASSCLEMKRSSRMTRSLDDHCALDLHRSKSYIVDLIDKALSKELGTIPRQQPVHHDMNPRRAIETISRHRQAGSKDLCYEVTAALTDSFISNVTAPPAVDSEQVRPSHSERQVQSDDDNKKKMCNPNYIKQLKQLRWGHIRHIQHEARKLADLEEFLEHCGETDL
ncbi:uncharacterized protein LOC143199377 [Rhynchophorus ferrugineus]|uniref:uncharacterized protein LOC143199377 n=1 Tax=Rhynchophorus ferrugineus TaxID=354439 RepID=UPI003FCEAD71